MNGVFVVFVELVFMFVVCNISEFCVVVLELFVLLQVFIGGFDYFCGVICGVFVDEVYVIEVWVILYVVECMFEFIVCGDNLYFKVSLMFVGIGLFIQDDWEVVFEVGDFVVYDIDCFYFFVFDVDFCIMVVMFLKYFISLLLIMIGQFIVVCILGQEGFGGMVVFYFMQFVGNFDQFVGIIGVCFVYSVFDFVIIVFM